ncbi:putative RNA polymerase sigma factor FecI [compost metagenome]
MASSDNALHQEITTLYSDHHGWLQGWLRKKLGDASKAADLTHDTFLRLLSREELIATREPRAFLTTVAQRVLFSHWRREELEHAYLNALMQLPEELAPSPEERAILLETLVEIDRMLDGLPLPVRRAFLYSQLDDMSHAEIAAELNISITTVKRYLVRAGVQCYFALAQA